jgi:hypothetical protein
MNVLAFSELINNSRTQPNFYLLQKIELKKQKWKKYSKIREFSSEYLLPEFPHNLLTTYYFIEQG